MIVIESWVMVVQCPVCWTIFGDVAIPHEDKVSRGNLNHWVIRITLT